MKWLLCSLLLLGSLARANDLDVNVEGPSDEGVYSVEGSFDVLASSTEVWSVLTDYDHMTEFLPSITSSTVSGTASGFIIVHQTFVAKFLFFNHSADALFEVSLIPNLDTITFRDVLHTDFARCDGMWSIEPDEELTHVRYSVRVIPGESAPHWIIRSVSRKMAVSLLEHLRTEMEKRANLAL